MSTAVFQSALDWFLPSDEEQDPMERPNYSIFVLLHLLGPLTALPLYALMFSSASGFYTHLAVIMVSTCVSFALPFVLRVMPKHFLALTIISLQNLLFLILYSSYHYGGFSSPILVWLLAMPIAAFLILGSTPLSRVLIGGVTTLNVTIFFAVCKWGPVLPQNFARDDMMALAMTSTISALVFVFLLSSYYGSMVQRKQELAMYLDKQRRKARRLKGAKDDALRANSAKSDFLANMSHELRTPLNAVLGYSEILLEDAELDGRTADIADLQKISAAGKHLLSMVNDILDLSKIEAGRAELSLETFNLESFIDEIEGIARPLAHKNNNAFVLLKGENLGDVHMDITKLRQSVLNLLSNAGKFTKNGQITLSVERVVSSDQGTEDQDRIAIEVRDTGVGISEESLDKMFKNFSQANATITAQFGGTGLGLSLSQNLCRLMGGEITLKSVLSEGSCFTINLPSDVQMPEETDSAQDEKQYSGLTDEARQIPEDTTGVRYHRSGNFSQAADLRMKIAEMQSMQIAAAKEGLKTGKSSILVIDDDRNVLDVAERLIEREGFQPVCADSPESVLQLARIVKPCAIILDVFMPGLDGWDVIGTLKSDAVTAQIPVIMISNSLDREKVKRHKAVGFIEKPLSSEKLKLALDTIAVSEAA